MASAVVSGPGVVPDFADSPEVLTWMWMLSGGRLLWVERPRWSWVAFFSESMDETQKRLGIVDASGLHLSVEFVNMDVAWRVRRRVISEILILCHIESLFIHMNAIKIRNETTYYSVNLQ